MVKKKKTLTNKLSKKTIARKVLKSSIPTIIIKEEPSENIFHDESRFFKDEFNKAKMEILA